MIENVGIPKCEAPEDDVLLMAGTSWLFARPGLEGLIDTLLIDEAGQVSLADSLAVGTCARNLILLGDPQQLSQVAQGGHPEQTAVSSLGHLLGDQRTIPAEQGLFIDVSRRMHPDVCRFVSEISYGGELTSLEECGRQVVASGAVWRRPARLPGRARRQPPRRPRGSRCDRGAGDAAGWRHGHAPRRHHESIGMPA